LNAIQSKHGIPWSEIVVKGRFGGYGGRGISEKEAYERYLKPATRSIKTCLEVLRSLGFEVFVEPASKKFRTRQGNYNVTGTVALMVDDNVVCALRYDNEIIPFLERVLSEGMDFLMKLPISESLFRPRKSKGVSEKDVLLKYADVLVNESFNVFINVKHNIMAGEKVTYSFQPDADIIAIKNSTILGFEVKGSEREEPSLKQVYTGIGEALFYLINPIGFMYNNRSYLGGIFDKVFLVMPTLPKNVDYLIVDILKTIRVVGLITFDEGIVFDPQPNPFLNLEKKEILLKNYYVLERYRYQKWVIKS